MTENKELRKVLIVVVIILVLGFSIFALVKKFSSEENNLPDTVNPQVQEAYEFAREHPDLLEQIPCNCGCASLGHKNNKDCYYDESGEMAEHGTTCGGCIGTTMDVKRLYEEGRSVQEIRAFIDEKYGSSEFAVPTDTPPVE